MSADTSYDRQFDSMPREELEGYARDWGIQGADGMSDTELRKRIKDAQGTTGTAPESDAPVEHRGDPGPGPAT
ncbi:MAG TPA: hypothetical protein VHF47_02115 [Acidimicrobiales bacterium]|nr:hypothetical protein [Acidimicrobiales bacterium]